MEVLTQKRPRPEKIYIYLRKQMIWSPPPHLQTAFYLN